MQKFQVQEQAIATPTAFRKELLVELPATDEQIVAAAILAEPSIEDCIVLNRTKVTSAQEFVAYVVSSGQFSPEQLHSRLQGTLPSDLLPIIYIPVSTLPLTPTGQVDELALNSLDVIDSDLVQRWEAKLHSLPKIEQAAVVAQDYTETIPPLHLSDLLPGWKTTGGSAPEALIIAASEVTTIEPDLQPKPIALSHGGALPFEPDAPSTLAEVLQRAARQTQGNHIFYLQPDGSEISRSYQDLLEDAERVLSGLRKLGLKPQDKVLFQLELNQDIISAFWGCILGGFIPVIMGVAPTYSQSNNAVEKLCNVWHLLEQPLILTTDTLYDAVQHLSQWLPSENLKLSTIENLRQNNQDSSYHHSQQDDPAFFNLTSGSTGMPKCISLTHWNLISRARGTNILSHHSSDDIILNWLPFDHIGSISDWHIRCVYLGCKLIYATKEYILGRPLNWLDLIDKYRITHSWAPNFAYALIYDAIKQVSQQSWDLSCVKALLTAGEAVSSIAVKDFIENLASYGFKITAIRPAFGMAEMGSGITYYQPTVENPLLFHTVDKASLKGSIKRVSLDHPNCTTFTDLGPVIPGVAIRIVDQENSLLPEDTIGYLQVKGDAVFAGYYKNPEINKEVFVEDRWFNTGDLGFISNGHLVVTGRAKETIIINGANYYNHEIEAVVEEIDLVDVSYTAACAVRDAKGTTDKLAIFFSTTLSNDEHLIELIKQIRQTVVSKVGANPDYLIPVLKEVIPKTAIGKIQRSQLSQRFEAGEFAPILKRLDIFLENANTLPDWFYRKIWQRKEVVSLSTQPQTGHTLIFLDSLGLGEFLCVQLNSNQRACISVEAGSDFVKLRCDRYRLNPKNPDHYLQLLEAFVEDKLQIGSILHLWNYEDYAGEITSPEMLEQAHERGIYSLLFLVQALAKVQGSKHPVRLLVAASHTQPTSPSDLVAPEKAPILGIIKAVSQEISWLDCRHVDLALDRQEVNAANILRELQVQQRSLEVAYRHGQRLVPCLEKVDWSKEPKQDMPFKPGGMYLLSGGLGGIGVEIAKYLLETYSVRLLLVGRTRLPERNTWDTEIEIGNAVAERIKAFLSLKQLGGEIEYETVDICDQLRLQQVVDQVKSRWQCQLDGVIHLAGTAPERLLIEETRDSLAATLNAKVLGTWALHQLLKDQPQSVFISFSSLASFFSGAMIGAYAAANSFLDCFSHYQRYQDLLQSYCFAWGMWEGIGISRNSQAKDLLRAKGYQSVTVKQGMYSFLSGLHHDQGQLLIGLDGNNRNIKRYAKTHSFWIQTLSAYFTANSQSISPAELKDLLVCDRFGTPSQCTFRQLQEMPLTHTGEIDRAQLTVISRARSTEQIKPRTELEQQLANIWQEVLGVSQVGINDNFFELGGSSLQAARLFAEIEKTFAKNLPLATLFEAPTVEQLVNFVSKEGEPVMWSTLVPIQSEGSKPPLFCVHGAGGNVLMYRQLIHYLDPDQPLYGIQPKGLDGKETPLNRIAEMAALYVEEMRKLQPQGPYFLTGLSAGGLIAFEMAQVLHAQNQQVGLLALIDPHAPGYPKLLPILPRLLSMLPPVAYHLAGRIPASVDKFIRSKVKRGFSELEQQTNLYSAKSQEPEEQELVDIEEVIDSKRHLPRQTNSFKERLEYFSLWLLKFTPWAFLVPRFYLDEGRFLSNTLQKIQQANVKAMLSYKPQVYIGQAILFRASQQPPGCYHDPYLGWGALVTGKLAVYDLPGYHSESLLYNEESVQVLGKQLRACLDTAEAED